jgi:hypothetical protein
VKKEKAVAIYLFLVLNGTWVFITYLLHTLGVRPVAIAFVVAIGAPLGNLALYAGLKLGEKLIRKSGT